MTNISKTIGSATWASILFGLMWSGLSFIFTETGAVVAAISFNLSLVVALFEHMERLTAERDRMRAAHESIKSRPMRELGECMLDATEEALLALACPAREFDHELPFFAYAGEQLCRLGKNDSIIVACADSLSRWLNCPHLAHWLAQNAHAVGRGVGFLRILLEVDPGMRPLAIAQARQGIRTIYLDHSKVDALPAKCRLPRDMGLAVVGTDRVYIHFGSGATFYGAFIENSMLAALVRSHLGLLESNGEVITVTDTPQAA